MEVDVDLSQIWRGACYERSKAASSSELKQSRKVVGVAEVVAGVHQRRWCIPKNRNDALEGVNREKRRRRRRSWVAVDFRRLRKRRWSRLKRRAEVFHRCPKEVSGGNTDKVAGLQLRSTDKWYALVIGGGRMFSR